uniref:glycosyl hydrolase family 18 protein n=1 Tax=uncultured Veillonella sp. TaxID=159268 RepID=UPI00262BB946
TDEVAFKDKESLWIPLSMYKRVNLNPITSEKNNTYITLPLPRVGGDMLYSGDMRQGTSKIKLPISMRNGIPYVDVKSISPSLGVVAVETADGVVLTAQVGAVPKPDVKEITNSVTLVFDPFVTTPYAHKVANEGTSVISPTLFDLGEKGLVAKSSLGIDYMLQYKVNGYQVWPLVTNTFDADFTSTILQDETKWPILGRDFVLYALAYGYEGYNFDFENVHYKDKEQLTKFVTYLADLLHTYNIKSSIDVTGYSESKKWSLVYDRKAYAKVVDYVVLMAYDETWASSTTAGPVASYPWVKRNVETMLEEVPAEKLILGVPYYMRIWTSKIQVDAKGQASISETKGKTLPMAEAEELKATYKDRVIWDDRLKTNYLVFGTNSLGEQLLMYKETGREPRLVVPVATGVSQLEPVRGLQATGSVATAAHNNETGDSNKNTGGSSKEIVDNNTAGSHTEIGDSHTEIGNSHTGVGLKESRIAGGLRNKSSFIKEVWFEDEASMGAKLGLIKEYKLAGFGAWRKGFETEAFANYMYKEYEEPKVEQQDKKTKKQSNKKADKNSDKKGTKKKV